MDVLASSYVDHKIVWYENDGLNNFETGQTISYPEYSDFLSVFSFDLDGDGDMDVLTASTWESRIAWYENYGTGNFGPRQIITFSTDELSSIFSIDLDGDGDIDVLSSSYSDNKIAWYENDGQENFGEQQMISNEINAIIKIVSKDLDGDGDLDLLSTSLTDQKIVWYENDGFEFFASQHIISNNVEASTIFSADLDGDGDMDVLAATVIGNKIAWYENDGLGNFGIEQIISTNAATPYYAFVTDLDSDGDLDVVNKKDNKIAWCENDGFGNFSYLQIISPETLDPVFSSDLDGDGDLDLLVASNFYNILAWHENDGQENFGEQQIISDQLDGTFVNSSDLDGDGDMDVLLASWDDNKIVWFENDGIGNFNDEQIISTQTEPVTVFTADFDGDGDIDVLTSSIEEFKVAWYENDGFGNFSDQQIIGILSTKYAYPVDLDDDGDLDVLSYGYYAISWHENIINEGCTDVTACNYDSSFLIEDGSCCYDNCGCTDEDAVNYDSQITCDDGSCIFLGCTDNTACNFDFYANQDDGSCVFPGCTNISADNYDDLAGCNDLSCFYKIQGLVFYDENENGLFDGLDYGLPFQEITSSNGLIYLTNDEGVFYTNATSESITFNLMGNESFPYNTTPNPQTLVDGINTGTNDFSLNFGISSDEPDFAICLDFYPPGVGYPCDDWVIHNLCFRNMGNVPINGVLAIEYDSLFQDYQEVTPIDSVVGNSIYMSFDNLMPGQMYFYDVSFLTPDFESIGDFITSTGRVYGFFEGEEVAYGESILVHEMTCAYDPNDKQVFPAGYADPHYVLPETRLEYLVRFQNTGNAPATNVLVTDTIDSTLDLNTFELVANSHSVITTIKTEERLIEFLFEDIMLPDSTINEPESHGLISYKLTPHIDLDYETEINNTAYIYFDNNPAIITNTAWSTIYDCNNGLSAFELLDTLICQSVEVDFENAQEYIEEYTWYVTNQVISTDSVLTHLFETADQYSIKLEVSNPLCEATDSIVVTINPIPEIVISNNVTLCLGESTILSASGGTSYDWDVEGSEPTFEVSPLITSNYEVTVTNEFNCSKTDSIEVIVNPLPIITVSDNVTLCQGEYTILTASGGETYDWNGEGTEPSLEITPLESTIYEVTVTNEFECTDVANIDITVNSLPSVFLQGDLLLCEGESTVLTASGGATYDWDGLGTNSTLQVTPTISTTYYVTVFNFFNCSITDSLEVIVDPTPVITLSDDISLCEGESTTLTASGGNSYDWNGQGTNSELEVSPTETTTYEVTVSNEFDCSDVGEITVSVNPLPTVEITVDQITLTAIEATTYQWYLNGNSIAEANAQTYIAQENGNYAVEVTNEFDCTSLSDEIIISVVGMKELSNHNIQLFPNPMQEYSVLYFGKSGVNYQVTLFDAEGRLVRNYGVLIDGQLEIQRKGLSSGNYLIEVVDINAGEKFGLQLVVE